MKKEKIRIDHIKPATQKAYFALSGIQRFFLATLVMRATWGIIVDKKTFYSVFNWLYSYGDIAPADIKAIQAAGFIRIRGSISHYAFIHSSVIDLTKADNATTTF